MRNNSGGIAFVSHRKREEKKRGSSTIIGGPKIVEKIPENLAPLAIDNTPQLIKKTLKSVTRDVNDNTITTCITNTCAFDRIHVFGRWEEEEKTWAANGSRKWETLTSKTANSARGAEQIAEGRRNPYNPPNPFPSPLPERGADSLAFHFINIHFTRNQRDVLQPAHRCRTNSADIAHSLALITGATRDANRTLKSWPGYSRITSMYVPVSTRRSVVVFVIALCFNPFGHASLYEDIL